jgi:hypothetical protein
MSEELVSLIARLRRMASTSLSPPPAESLTLWAAADELERLQRELNKLQGELLLLRALIYASGGSAGVYGAPVTAEKQTRRHQ